MSKKWFFYGFFLAMSLLLAVDAYASNPCPMLKSFQDSAAANADGRKFVVYLRSENCIECDKLERYMALNAMSIDESLKIELGATSKGVPVLIPIDKNGRASRPVIGFEAASAWIYGEIK